MKKIEGGPGYPNIMLTEAALKSTGGSAEFDLDVLNTLVHEHMGLRDSVTPTYVFYGRFKRTLALGLHPIFTNLALIQLPASVQASANKGAAPEEELIKTVVHESFNLVSSKEHKLRTVAEWVLGMAAASACLGVGYVFSQAAPDELEGVVMAGLAYTLWQNFYVALIDPRERRAERAAENQEYIAASRGMIRLTGHEAGSSIYDWADEPVPYNWADETS